MRYHTVLFSLFVIFGCVGTFLMYIRHNMTYVVHLWIILFMCSTVLGGTVKSTNDYIGTLELFLRMSALLMCMLFLFNGIGLALENLGFVNMTIIALNVQNSVGDIFASLMFDSQMVIVVGFAILGMILVNIGDAQDSPDVYTIGALALTVIPGIMCIVTLTGWVAPGYPWNTFGAMAPLAKFVGVATVTMLIASIGFMFDDLIKSSVAGE